MNSSHGKNKDGAKAPGKEVALTREQALSTDVQDFGDDAGAGMENLGQDEQTIPFLRIIQSNSPIITENKVPGAKAGQIFNSATLGVMDGFEALLAHRDHNYIEWTPRDAGGGFLGVHDPENPDIQIMRKEQGQFGKLKGNGGQSEFVETFYHYVFAKALAEGGMAFRALIPYASTQIGKYKNLNTRINTELLYPNPKGAREAPIRPPMWAHRFKFTTQPEKNKKGNFFGWKIDLGATDEETDAYAAAFKEKYAVDLPRTEARKRASLIIPSHPLYVEAKAFYELIKAGKAKVDYSKMGSDGEGDGDEPPM